LDDRVDAEGSCQPSALAVHDHVRAAWLRSAQEPQRRDHARSAGPGHGVGAVNAFLRFHRSLRHLIGGAAMTASIRRRCGYGMTAGLVAIAFCMVTVAQKDPMIGTWKINPGGKFSPGPAPKSQTVTIEAAGAGRKVTVDVVSGTGTAAKWSYTANFDSKDSK